MTIENCETFARGNLPQPNAPISAPGCQVVADGLIVLVLAIDFGKGFF